MALQPHLVPERLISWGVPPLPRQRGVVDTWARDELRQHTAALHHTLHGTGNTDTCSRCSRLVAQQTSHPNDHKEVA